MFLSISGPERQNNRTVPISFLTLKASRGPNNTAFCAIAMKSRFRQKAGLAIVSESIWRRPSYFNIPRGNSPAVFAHGNVAAGVPHRHGPLTSFVSFLHL